MARMRGPVAHHGRCERQLGTARRWPRARKAWPTRRRGWHVTTCQACYVTTWPARGAGRYVITSGRRPPAAREGAHASERARTRGEGAAARARAVQSAGAVIAIASPTVSPSSCRTNSSESMDGRLEVLTELTSAAEARPNSARVPGSELRRRQTQAASRQGRCVLNASCICRHWTCRRSARVVSPGRHPAERHGTAVDHLEK
eukprot:7379927-Prymnesium_polylepis.1